MTHLVKIQSTFFIPKRTHLNIKARHDTDKHSISKETA